MLNPEQVKRLKIQVSNDPNGRIFEGRHIATTLFEALQTNLPATHIDVTKVKLTPPDLIIGSPVEPSCLNGVEERFYNVPVPRVTTVKNGSVIGSAAILSEDNVLYLPDDVRTIPTATLEFESRHGHQGFALVSANKNGGWAAFYPARESPKKYELKALFLHNLEAANYGSFISRQLPQILHALQLELEFNCIITPTRTPWMMEALYLTGLGSVPVFSGSEITGDIFASISFFNQFDAEGLFSEETRALFRSFSEKLFRSEVKSESSKSIYVSRSLAALAKPQYRQLLNDAETEAKLRLAGYDIVYPEVLRLSEQVRIFSKAKKIFGPSGSGLLNCAFSGPNAKIVDIETHNVSVRQHAKIYSSSGNRYAFGFVTPDCSDTSPLTQRRWRLPEEIVDRALAWLDN